MSTLTTLDALNRAVSAKGWTPLSKWWTATLTRFVTSRRRQLVARVGRRGGKSSTLCRFAVAFALAFDCSQIPPGDVGVVAFISVSRDEAAQRLRTIKALFDALAIAYRPIDGGIELRDRPIAFKVYTASIAGVSGFTAILVICDEVAKWRDSDTGANPATEVLASVRPTMATQACALIILSSSPVGMGDAHATAFDVGDSDHQTIAFATSWEANPILTEQSCRRDEPDLRIFDREYRAIPQAAKLAAFDADATARAFTHPRPKGLLSQRYLVLDPSSGKKDVFTFGVCAWVMPETAGAFAPYLAFDLIDGIDASYWAQANGALIADKLQAVSNEWECTSTHADQREELMLGAALQERHMRYVVHPWTAQSKPQAIERVRRWFAEGTIALPEHDTLRRELLAFEERITPSGAFTFGARGSGHDDFVSLLITAALAELEGDLVAQRRHDIAAINRRLQSTGSSYRDLGEGRGFRSR